MAPDSLRDRTRRAVRAELFAVSQALIVEHGFEAVTVEQIAAAAGLSRRSFFRYFPSKEALVIGKYEQFGEALVAALQARPADESVWTSLRRMFDPMAAYLSDADRRAEADAMQRVILASPSLHGGFLRAQEPTRAAAVEVLVERLGPDASTLQLTAIVGAAFGCYQAAISFAAANHETTFAEALDVAWTSIAVETTPSG